MSNINIPQAKKNLLQHIQSLEVKNLKSDADLKFFYLFRSRLNEEGIPIDAANILALNCPTTLQELDEEDDYIGDIALALAEKYAILYQHIVSLNLEKHIANQKVLQYFEIINVDLFEFDY